MLTLFDDDNRRRPAYDLTYRLNVHDIRLRAYVVNDHADLFPQWRWRIRQALQPTENFMPIDPLVLTSLKSLYGDVVSRDRFRDWRADVGGNSEVAKALDDVLLGEIYWRKELGRPEGSTLASAFEIEASRMERFADFNDPKGYTEIPHFLPARLSDGVSDDDFWRVAYMVQNLAPGDRYDYLTGGSWTQHTFVTPRMKPSVRWHTVGGDIALANAGIRSFDPSGIAFVKKPGTTHFSFRIVVRSPLTQGPDGIIGS